MSNPLRTQQIIPEGPAWPASAREYTNFKLSNSQRDTSSTTTITPDKKSQQQTWKRNMSFERGKTEKNRVLNTTPLKNRQSGFFFKSFPSVVKLNDFGGIEKSRQWNIRI